MRCKCCDAEMYHTTTRQVKVPHATRKGHYTIKHEEEDLCGKCITISNNYSSGFYTDEDTENFSELGIDIPTFELDNY